MDWTIVENGLRVVAIAVVFFLLGAVPAFFAGVQEGRRQLGDRPHS